ncbi:AraC family transcriptional regulator [Gammaproteobacteria bacterium AS21]
MSAKQHSINIHFANALLKAAKKNDLDQQPLLAAANLSNELLHNPQVRITPLQLSQLMHAIWCAADDEYLCLGSQPSKHGVFSMMAKQVLGSANLRQVYRRGIHFYNLVAAATAFRFQETSQYARFCITLTQPEKDEEHALIEFLLLLWHRFPSWLIGQRIPLTRVGFSHHKPAHYDEYRLMFACDIHYQQSENYLEFDKTCLTAAIVQTQQSLSAYLRRCPLDWFQRQSYFDIYTRKVIDALEQSGDIKSANMQQVATSLHMTTRTLRRKLLEEGTNFQQLKDNIRRDIAIQYLSRPDMSIATIGQILGFCEAGAFTRAFKKWTKMAPSTYRKGQ